MIFIKNERLKFLQYFLLNLLFYLFKSFSILQIAYS